MQSKYERLLSQWHRHLHCWPCWHDQSLGQFDWWARYPRKTGFPLGIWLIQLRNEGVGLSHGNGGCRESAEEAKEKRFLGLHLQNAGEDEIEKRFLVTLAGMVCLLKDCG